MSKTIRRHSDDDDDDFETIIGHDGKPARVLRDQHVLRVPMHLRDSAHLRALRDAQPPQQHDGRRPLSDRERAELRGCQPGFRVVMNDERIRERQQFARDARAAAEQEMCDAWRHPVSGLGLGRDANGNGNGFGSNGFRGQQEGDACSINGAPGTLQERDGGIPDDDNGDDDQIFDGVDARAASYRAYDREISQRWRRR
jgi:hypothetical protein